VIKSARIACVPANVPAELFSNSSQERYQYANPFCVVVIIIIIIIIVIIIIIIRNYGERRGRAMNEIGTHDLCLSDVKTCHSKMCPRTRTGSYRVHRK
jgi:hypothetical protein